MLTESDKIIAVIPARAGSKRLPQKNILPIAGRPCIEWTLVAACESKEIDHIVVSTDDPKVEAIVGRYDEVALIKRPPHLAQDGSSAIDVALHVLDLKESEGEKLSWLVLLQPTSPLRTSDHIDQALRLVRERGADGLVSICRTAHPREWIAPAAPGASLQPFFLETNLEKSAAELPVSYTVNGAIYLIRVDLFRKEKTFFPMREIIGYEMDRRCSVDIDDEYDFAVASWSLNESLR